MTRLDSVQVKVLQIWYAKDPHPSQIHRQALVTTINSICSEIKTHVPSYTCRHVTVKQVTGWFTRHQRQGQQQQQTVSSSSSSMHQQILASLSSDDESDSNAPISPCQADSQLVVVASHPTKPHLMALAWMHNTYTEQQICNLVEQNLTSCVAAKRPPRYQRLDDQQKEALMVAYLNHGVIRHGQTVMMKQLQEETGLSGCTIVRWMEDRQRKEGGAADRLSELWQNGWIHILLTGGILLMQHVSGEWKDYLTDLVHILVVGTLPDTPSDSITTEER